MSVRERMNKKPAKETRKVTREEALRAFYQDIDPMHYAGEGFTATDEIPRPRDVAHNPYLLARVLNEEDYWPTAARRKKR